MNSQMHIFLNMQKPSRLGVSNWIDAVGFPVNFVKYHRGRVLLNWIWGEILFLHHSPGRCDVLGSGHCSSLQWLMSCMYIRLATPNPELGKDVKDSISRCIPICSIICCMFKSVYIKIDYSRCLKNTDQNRIGNF